MSAPAQASLAVSGGLAPALSAARARLGLVALLFAVAALGWWWTGDRMRGMDNGPWTGLGSFGWFLGVWVVMMAAMIVAFGTGVALNSISGDLFTWDRAGRWTAGGTLVVAAVYELTPLKDVCLGKCRSPLGSLLGSWRDGLSGALQMGAKNGAWCVGCCWALMASLFALGIMSVMWMAVVAGLIAFEKTVPWRRVASYGTAAALLALGVLVLIAPGAIPGLTTPRDTPMQQMTPMDS
jgi:predicted metal-binding membrane protein